MRQRSFGSITRALLAGLDLLTVALVVLAVAVAAHRGVHVWLMASLGAVFLAVYLVGRATVRTTAEPPTLARGQLWPQGVWLGALVVAWVVLLWFSPTALWIAFPLMLLAMHALGPHRGPIALLLITVVAVGSTLRDGVRGWSSLGGVVGPLVGAAVSAAVVMGLEALARESALRQQMVDELSEARHYLAEFDRERAVLGERERLAREIHDTLTQGFSGIDLLLRAARPQIGDDAAGALVDQAAVTARENLVEARRLVRALAPADLEEHTLVAALRRQTERTGQPDLTAALHVNGEPVPLPLPTEAALLRVAQSALANVGQHAHASRVDLALTYTDDEVLLDVVDNGVGFDPAPPVSSPPDDTGVRTTETAGGSGFGLTAMASRVRELGGRFEVESTPGQGTAVAVALPIDERRDR